MEQRRRTLLKAFSRHLTSTLDVVCALLTESMLVVPSTRRSTLGDRAFPVASARAWNSLPSSVRNVPSLTTFRRELKTVLFRSSFDDDQAIVTALHHITVVYPWLLTVGDSVFFVLFCLILYGAAAMFLTWKYHFNQYIVTYLLTYLSEWTCVCLWGTWDVARVMQNKASGSHERSDDSPLSTCVQAVDGQWTRLPVSIVDEVVEDRETKERTATGQPHHQTTRCSSINTRLTN